MKHRVFLGKEGFIETIYDGDISLGDSEKMFEKRYELSYGLQDQGKPVNLLVDVRNIGKVDPKEISAFVGLSLKSLNFRRLAVFGAKKEIAALAKVLLTLAGKVKQLGIFKTREEAVAWLQG